MLNSMYDHVMKPQCSKLNFTNNNDTFTIAKNTSEGKLKKIYMYIFSKFHIKLSYISHVYIFHY